MEKVDLHVHSTYSDGTKTPKELIEIAEKEGLSAIALTDHDTLDGIPAALAASDKSPVELIPGVELSTNFDRTEVHIVGLFLDYTNNEINNYLAKQRQSRIDRNIQMCQKFCDIGINITYDKMCELYPDAVSQEHILLTILLKINIQVTETKPLTDTFHRESHAMSADIRLTQRMLSI